MLMPLRKSVGVPEVMRCVIAMFHAFVVYKNYNI